jgi:hypothetical protein
MRMYSIDSMAPIAGRRPRRRFPLTPVLLALALATCCTTQQASAHVIPMTDRQMVHFSDHVVVATVEGATSRWNERRDLIETVYTLRVDEGLKGTSPARITVSVPGGTLDGETQWTCLSTPLATGGKYLLFLGDLEQPALTPFTGGWQGIFRALPGPGGRLYAASGAAPAEPMKAGGRTVEFAELVAAVRGLIRDVEAAPLAESELRVAGKSGRSLPAKQYLPGTGRVTAAAALAASLPPTSLDSPEILPQTATDVSGDAPGQTTEAVFAGRRAATPGFEKSFYFHRASSPVVFNQLPDYFDFAPHDQYMMAYWNKYADVFRVYTSPTDTWRFGDGVFDITGFPDNSQMNQQFGRGWGVGVLAVTYSRFDSSTGPIVESDVAMNPAYDWTTDNNLATTTNSQVYSFDHVILHELGHTWGLQHPWEYQDVWWDSVMNYTSQPFMQTRLCADDVQGIRSAFPGVSLHDIALYSYTTQDVPGDNNPAYTATRPGTTSVRAGAKLGLSGPIRLENLGTDVVTNPSVEVYLAPQRSSFTGAVRIKTSKFNMKAQPLSVWHLSFAAMTVPKSVKPGTYYLAFFVRDTKDKYQNNNSTWTVYGATVTVTR